MLTHKGSLNFRPEIHGLRAIAVILVIVFHLNPSWMPFGYVGVDIFFVISGFLITRIILKQIEAGTFKFSEFLTRRIKRIFPALFVVLIVSLIVAILVLSSLDYKEFCRSLRYASFQGGNFFFERNSGYFDLSSKYQVLLHTWSLGVEEQFYLAWPILLLIIHRLKYPKILPMLIVIPASLAGMVYFNSIESLKGFYMFYCRAWEFSLGALLATNKIKPLKSPLANEVLAFLGLSLVACSLFLGSAQHSQETFFLFLTCLGTCTLIYSSSEKGTFISRTLSLKPLLFIGAISYSLYLWHWPVITFHNYIREFHLMSIGQLTTESLNIADLIVIISLTMTFSLISYKWIEIPYRNAKSGNRKTISVGIVLILLGAGMAKVAQEQSTKPWRIKSSSNQYSLADLEIDIADHSYKAKPPTLLIMGDSHAEHFTPMIQQWARQQGIDAAKIHRGGTAPLATLTHFSSFLSYREQKHVGEIYTYIKDNPSITHVVLAGRYSHYIEHSDFLPAFTETIEFLLNRGTKIAILGQTPPLDSFNIRFLLPTHVINSSFPPKMNIDELMKFNPSATKKALKPMRTFLDHLSKDHPSIYIWHPEDYIENGSIQGIPLYQDNSHLNLKGSLHFLPYFNFPVSSNEKNDELQTKPR